METLSVSFQNTVRMKQSMVLVQIVIPSGMGIAMPKSQKTRLTNAISAKIIRIAVYKRFPKL